MPQRPEDHRPVHRVLMWVSPAMVTRVNMRKLRYAASAAVIVAAVVVYFVWVLSMVPPHAGS